MKLKLKMKVNWQLVYLFFMLMPYLKPYNITLIPSVDAIFKVWKIVATFFIIFRFFKKRHILHVESVYLFIFCAVWGVSLIINEGPIVEYGNNILSILGMVLLFEVGYKNSIFKKNITCLIYNIGAVYQVLNLITVIQGYPFGAYGIRLNDNANFLGGDNYSAFILIALAGIMFFYDDCYVGKIRRRTWCFSLLGLASLVIPFAFTGIVSYTLLLLMVVFHKYPIVKKFFKWKYIFAVCLIVILAVSYFHLDEFLVKMLNSMNKAGFNGRSLIWPMTITAIMKKPILGYGGLTEEQAGTWLIAGANHAHNFILQYPFSVGVIGTFFIILYFVKILKGSMQLSNQSCRVLLMCLSAFMICSFFDFYIGLIYFYLLLEMIWIHKME